MAFKYVSLGVFITGCLAVILSVSLPALRYGDRLLSLVKKERYFDAVLLAGQIDSLSLSKSIEAVPTENRSRLFDAMRELAAARLRYKCFAGSRRLIDILLKHQGKSPANLLLLACLYENSGRKDKARRIYLDMLKEHPMLVLPYERLLSLYADDADRIFDLFGKFSRNRLNDKLLLLDFAAALEASHSYARAVDVYSYALKTGKDPVIENRLKAVKTAMLAGRTGK